MSSREAEIGSATSLGLSRGETRMSETFAQPTAGSSFEPDLVDTAGLAARIVGALAMAVLVVAVAVRLAFAAPARHWLAFPFAGIPARPTVAATVFLHNLRALLAVGGLLLVAQSPYWAARDPTPRLVHRLMRGAGEAVLAAAVAANVIVIGASCGVYGLRMVRAALPHGPIELAGYALALALYLQGRHRRLPTRHILAVASLSVAALALAALLETFVNV